MSHLCCLVGTSLSGPSRRGLKRWGRSWTKPSADRSALAIARRDRHRPGSPGGRQCSRVMTRNEIQCRIRILGTWVSALTLDQAVIRD
jgi:hypothetical protein